MPLPAETRAWMRRSVGPPYDAPTADAQATGPMLQATRLLLFPARVGVAPSTVVPEIESSPAYKTGGLIAITLKCAEEEHKTTVHMLVEDDGPGVAEVHRDRIFEPFYTTKQDVGTGLGLWVSREIIERHGGTIGLIDRENGAPGAAFSVVFEGLPSK